jgi:hypothetical protein
LLAAVGVISAVVLTKSDEWDWSPAKLATPPSLLWWLGATAAAGAVLALALALWPRRATASAPGWPRWFGEVAFEARRGNRSAEALADFTRRLRDSAPDPFSRACHQLWVVSQIADSKLLAIRTALVLLGASLTLMLLSVGVDAVFWSR